MDSGPLDGTLYTWEEIEGEFEWRVLLLGNGLSINVWPHFAYDALFDYASDSDLEPEELALFGGTPNFERVLADLNTAIRVAETLGFDASPFAKKYRRIQLALGDAIREVHLTRSMVPEFTLESIRDEMLGYEWIFTTSYDLLVYWAMGASANERFEPFMDHFRYNSRCQFDPDRAGELANRIPVYFLHGALHLVVDGTGKTWKLRRTSIQTLLEQFGELIPSNPQARPLLVTEGSAQDKVIAIERNEYLSHCLDRLSSVDQPVVVFGSSLSHSDQHIVEALNQNPNRPVAVSLYPKGKRELAAQQSDIYARVLARPLLFFDSASHPLGDADLEAET